MTRTITCSAPGKILLTGGYLVLDPSYPGFVLSLSARIFASVSYTPAVSRNQIRVTSPQFPGAIWDFESTEHELQCVSQPDNPFVREALVTVLSYLGVLSDFRSFQVTILADNQYYSLPQNPFGNRFTKSTHSISETPKTGLGSSAALITSLCSALYFFLSSNKETEALTSFTILKIHNLAQISHCRAQGKVGSGFDIASAVFGSCLYSRFPPSLIDALPPVSSSSFPQALRDVVDTQWPMTAERVHLRKSYKLLMGDVKQGSSTPGMVKKVMASPAALDLWPSLAISNEVLSEYLTASASNVPEIAAVRDATRSVRGLLKEMGVAAGVEIEPDEQTTVLDETLMMPGVVSCGVPGAGGYDALFAIIEDDLCGETGNTKEMAIERLWKERGVTRLAVSADGQGIKVEVDFDGSL